MDVHLLSADFSLDCAMKSDTAARCGMDNTPPAAAFPRLAAVAQHILQPILAHYGHPPAINSFYRSVALNTAVGGVRDSQHVRGEAVDLHMPGLNNFALAGWIRDNVVFDQLILEYYTPGKLNSGWVHVSFVDEAAPENIAAGRKNRREVLTMGKGYCLPGLCA